MATYTYQQTDDIIELTFYGDITLEQSFDFKEEIKAKFSDDTIKNVLVNLEEVTFMDSSGLGMLISFFKEVNQKQGCIAYYGIHDYVKKLLALVKLDQVFNIYETREAALNGILNK